VSEIRGSSGTAGNGSVLNGVIEILEDITREWDTGFSGRIGPATLLMNDLTFESIDIVMMIVAIEERFGRKGLPFDRLLTVDGGYVDDLRVADLARFLEGELGTGSAS
jgi:acyl carrier protein